MLLCEVHFLARTLRCTPAPDGKYIHFDNASNSRIVETIKNNKTWTTYVTERKPIKTRIVGTLNGDVVVIKELHLQKLALRQQVSAQLMWKLHDYLLEMQQGFCRRVRPARRFATR